MLLEDSDIGKHIIQTEWREIHAEGYYTGTFRESEGCLIPKGNAKSRCKAVRVINKLCPAGNTFTSMLWNRSQTKKRDFAFGFTGRRREQAILIASTTKWRLGKLGISHIQATRDVANAFPSMGHCALGGMIDNTC